MNLYAEAKYLTPPWEDLTDKVYRKKDINAEFKMLFDETYHYFKEYTEEVLSSNKPLDLDLFFAHLSLVSAFTLFTEEAHYGYNEEIINIGGISKTFLTCYVLSDLYHEYFYEDKMVLHIRELDNIRIFELYEFETGNITEEKKMVLD